MKKRLFVFLCMATMLLGAPAWAAKPASFGLSVAGMKIGTGDQTWSVGQHSLASYGQNLYAAWLDENYTEVKVATSMDSGLTWGPTATASVLTSGSSHGVVIAVSDNNGSPVVHVTWDAPGDPQESIYYSRSTDNGKHFSSPVLLTSNSTYSISLAAHNNYVHTVWVAPNGDILYSRSTDYGVTWETSQVIQSGDNAVQPNIAANTLGKVYIAWTNFTTGQRAVKLRVSTDDGATWGGVSQYEGDFSYLSLGVDNTSQVYILTNYMNNLVCIHFDGTTWSESPIGLQGNGDEASLAVDPSGNPAIAFSYSDAGTGYFYFSRSTDYGVSWTSTLIDNDWYLYPNLTIDDNGKANIFWGKWFSGYSNLAIHFTKEQ